MAEPSIPYEVGRFYRELSELQGYLAELRHIDTGMAYLEEEKARWWHDVPLVGSGTSYVEIEFGTTFPFKKIYHVPEDYIRFFWEDTKKEEVENHLRVLAEQANVWAADEIGTITSRIQPFTRPVGSLYESRCIDPVLIAHDTLDDEVSADFGQLSHSLGNWEGEAADNFATRFYNPFEHTLRSQKQLLTALAGGIAAAKAIAESTQHSLMNVVHFTRDAVREQLELCQARAEIARQESVRNVLIIAGGGATVFGGIVGGGLWAAGVGAVSGGISIASTAIPEGGSGEFDLHGATAEALLGSMFRAIGLVVTNDISQHEKLGNEIQAVLDRVDALRAGGDREDGRLIPIQPNIVSGVDSTDFYLP